MFELTRYSPDYEVVVLEADDGATFVHDDFLAESIKSADFFQCLTGSSSVAYNSGEGGTNHFPGSAAPRFSSLADAQEWVQMKQRATAFGERVFN